MCLGAIFWARAERYYFSATREDAARAGFDDASIYSELNVKAEERSIPGRRVDIEERYLPFVEWARSPNKQTY